MTNPQSPQLDRPLRVAVIGGGVAGSTIALRLATAGVETFLLEQNASLINSPPMCHLHAGGNLYREIPLEDCKTLLRQCIDIARLYPDSIDVRPTVITVPKRDRGNASDLLPRLVALTEYYTELLAQDARNAVLGAPADYYRLYNHDDLAQLAHQTPPATADDARVTDDWLAAFVHVVDWQKLQLPVVAVQEYGWNIFRLAASAELQLAKLPNAHVWTHTKVHGLQAQHATDGAATGWSIDYQTTGQDHAQLTVDFVVNACGFRTGTLDDMAGIHAKRMVEFKASYISHWQPQMALPEIIFHGERGTPQGMAQFTPYTHGYVQLHGMTPNITLFENGLTHSTADSAQPPVAAEHVRYIEQGWDKAVLQTRTESAIAYVSEFIPKFAHAEPVDNALYGAQQVPSDDISQRVADCQIFADKRYAIAENIKANSALDVADLIVEALIAQDLLDPQYRAHPQWQRLNAQAVEARAIELAKQRHYPIDMAKVNHALVLPE